MNRRALARSWEKERSDDSGSIRWVASTGEADRQQLQHSRAAECRATRKDCCRTTTRDQSPHRAGWRGEASVSQASGASVTEARENEREGELTGWGTS